MKHVFRRLFCLFSFAVLPAASVLAQAAPKVPSFDVVSIKPNNSGSGMIRIMFGDDRCEMSNVTLGMMIQNAFGLKPSQLTGLPAWANSDHFDVQCKVVDEDKALLKNLTPEQRRPMYQAILKDRFGMQYHMETKNMAVYDLVVDKNGPKVQALPPQTDAEKEEAKKAAQGPPSISADGKLPRGFGRGSMMTRRTPDGFQLSASGVKMEGLANMLSNQAGRIVVDKTNLAGEYSFDLRWAPEEGMPGAQHADSAAPTEALPSIFTAVQEQLGLRLVSSKGDVELLVIDHVDRPSEN